MKKQELIQMYNRTNARRMIFLISIIIGYLLARIPIWIFHSEVVTYMSSLNEIGKILTLTAVFIGIPILSATTLARFAYKKKYDVRIINYFEKRRQKKIEEADEKLRSLKAEKKVLVKQAKESYRIQDFVPTETPFLFNLKLGENIMPGLEPIVRLNNNEIGYNKISQNIIQIHLRKYANTTDNQMTIGIGEIQIPFNNPYLFDSTKNEYIKWQCEGHAEERIILLPISYLPNHFTGVVYEFELKIGRVHFGKFTGKFDKESQCILIYLGRQIQKSDMRGDNKVATLSFLGNKITLPKPTIIYNQHVRV